MRQPDIEPTSPATIRGRSACCTALVLVRALLILSVIGTIVSGCILVPYDGWGDGEYHHHRHHRWEDD